MRCSTAIHDSTLSTPNTAGSNTNKPLFPSVLLHQLNLSILGMVSVLTGLVALPFQLVHLNALVPLLLHNPHSSSMITFRPLQMTVSLSKMGNL